MPLGLFHILATFLLSTEYHIFVVLNQSQNKSKHSLHHLKVYIHLALSTPEHIASYTLIVSDQLLIS